jgi:Tol biopolymer transport system component
MRRLPVPAARRYIGGVAVLAALVCLTATAQATFPGKNGRIAFSSDRSGTLEIYTARPDGSDVRQLTRSGELLSAYPDWSPDGRWIVFDRFNPETERGHILLMRADGTGLRRLTNGAGSNGDPAFSPNGRRIVFFHQVGNRHPELFTMKRDGSDWHRVTRTPLTAEVFPQYSPDGKWIAYTRLPPGEHAAPAVFIVRANGGTPRRVTPDRLRAGVADWSPDGRRLVFASNIDVPHSSIYTIRANGTDIRRLTGGPRFVDEFDPSYSPDGRHISFTSDRLGENRFDIWVMNADGSHPRRITHTRKAFEFATDWGPRP